MKRDPLGDRMKGYEAVSRLALMRRSCLIVRVDGRAFHDEALADDMVVAAAKVASGMQGFRAAYHQSDEVSFLLHDFERLETEPWFGNDLQKIVSVTASEFTREFNDARWERNAISPSMPTRTATFDARAFTIPTDEVANYFLWRARDWHRNSLFMYASSFFSAKDLLSKGRAELHEMLHSRGKNWTTDVPERFRNGTFIRYRPKIEPSERSALIRLDEVLPQYAAVSAFLAPLLIRLDA